MLTLSEITKNLYHQGRGKKRSTHFQEILRLSPNTEGHLFNLLMRKFLHNLSEVFGFNFNHDVNLNVRKLKVRIKQSY